VNWLTFGRAVRRPGGTPTEDGDGRRRGAARLGVGTSEVCDTRDARMATAFVHGSDVIERMMSDRCGLHVRARRSALRRAMHKPPGRLVLGYTTDPVKLPYCTLK
jgi:hypothetical protein